MGKLEQPKISGKYDTGQLILHKVFGYRGVILFPWLARVYDRDATNKKESTDSKGVAEASGDSLSNVGKEVKGRTHTFYQVLIDTRDAPYIVSISSLKHKFICMSCYKLLEITNLFIFSKILVPLNYILKICVLYFIMYFYFLFVLLYWLNCTKRNVWFILEYAYKHRHET